MTQNLKDLRQRLGRLAVAAAEANSPTVEVSRQDLRTVLVALDEIIEPASEREVGL
jgi:formyltetrahydrofolate synthetase